MADVHPLFLLAQQRFEERAKQYDAGTIKVEDYAVFGMASWGHDVHKEALRTCSWIFQDNLDKVIEHLVDLCVYATFLYDKACAELEARKK